MELVDAELARTREAVAAAKATVARNDETIAGLLAILMGAGGGGGGAR